MQAKQQNLPAAPTLAKDKTISEKAHSAKGSKENIDKTKHVDKKKRGLSLKYKILILLTIVPVLTLSAYQLLAQKIFEQDKIAYVFDSTANMAASRSAQINTQLVSVLNSCRTIFQEYLLQGKFASVSETSFQDEVSLDAVVVYQRDPATASFVKSGFLEKSPLMVMGFESQVDSQINRFLEDTQKEGRLVRAPTQDDKLFVFEKIVDPKKNQTLIFMIVVRLSEVAEVFSPNAAQKLYLISKSGQILFGPEGTQGKNLSTIFSTSFLADSSAKVAVGAEEAEDDSGRKTLVSYSKVGFGDLIVVSTVAKDTALSALKILLKKSIVFFVILICLTIIVSLIASGTVTQALKSLFDATQKVSEGDFNIRVNVKSTDEVGALADNFNIMAAEVARLLEQTAEKARMEGELQTAKTVQETLFPEAVAKIGPLAISGFYEPASECGGDWWHYCQVGERVFLWIGDATGHGAPAALITSAAKSASTIIERLDIGPGQAMSLLNRAIYDVSKGKIMMTFFLASFDLNTHTLTYANASHEAPYLIKKAEGPPKKKDLISLNEVINPRLGQKRDTEYEEVSIQLDLGDAIFFYTDGIPDIQNPDFEAWGEREFIKTLVGTQKDYPNVVQARDRFTKIFQDYRKGTVLKDDVTFFVVKNDGVG